MQYSLLAPPPPYQAALDTPVGRLMIEGSREAITAVRWVASDAPAGKSCKVVIQARKQLREYFKGKRQTFDLPIDLSRLTEFQRTVLSHVSAVNYGETTTYGEIARKLHKVTAPRAVGQANARNPHLHHRAVPSRAQHQRQAYRLRRRRQSQRMAVAARKGAARLNGELGMPNGE